MDSRSEFVVDAPTPKRIDQYLMDRFPGYSRTYFQYLIEKEHVRINGAPVKKRQLPRPNDVITVTFLAKPLPTLLAENLPLEILFEDQDLLCINKPAGMVVHPAPGHPRKTFANALLYRATSLDVSPHDVRPGIVHRLDKDTSGVLIGAKTSFAQAKLTALFSARQVKKFYLAICAHRPKDCVVQEPIGRDPQDRKKMATIPGRGKKAITKITPLATLQDFTLVCAQPITGRTHQIRVHLHFLGCPILGDPMYGPTKLNQKWKITRQLLHAYRTQFHHPVSGTLLSLTAPLPKILQKWATKSALQSAEALMDLEP